MASLPDHAMMTKDVTTLRESIGLPAGHHQHRNFCHAAGGGEGQRRLMLGLVVPGRESPITAVVSATSGDAAPGRQSCSASTCEAWVRAPVSMTLEQLGRHAGGAKRAYQLWGRRHGRPQEQDRSLLRQR